LLYSSIPAMILGLKKIPIAKELHNKILLTDAKAQKSDYLTAFAAIVGILGVGAGIWWADAVAALIISGAVLKDGITQTKTAVLDLMDRYPEVVTGEKEDPVVSEINEIVNSWDWVKEAAVRFREHGQVYFGEIAIVPKNEINLDKLQKGYDILKEYHWKIHDFSIVPVKKLPKWE